MVDLSSRQGEIRLEGESRRVRWAAAWTAAHDGLACGDRHLVLDLGGRVVFGVVDGLGHGPEAAVAAEAAIASFVSATGRGGVRELIAACHGGLNGTRGAVATIVEVDRFGSLSWVGVGNVASAVLRAGPDLSAVDLDAAPGILGMGAPRMVDRRMQLFDGDVLLMATDGVDARFRWDADVSGDPHQVVQRAIGAWAGVADDALLLAARYVDRGRQ